MKKILIFTVFVISVLFAESQQIYVSRIWQGASGSPVFNPILNQFGVQWSNSITAPNGDLITVGHTQVSGQGENILLTRYDPDGNLVFSSNYNVAAANNDYGINVTLDGSGNIYVCGTTDNAGSTDFDVVVLKFGSTGSLINSYIYAGGSGLNDIGTSMTYDATSGLLYVGGTTENATSSYDYLVLQIDPSTLMLQGTTSYDYANLTDVTMGIEMGTGGTINLIGGSANSVVDWDYSVVKFGSTLTFISDTRVSIPGIGFDQPLAFCKDASQNIYITGRASTNGINYDIRTVKVLANMTIAWNQTYDYAGLEDVGNTISLDANGDVIVGGFITGTNGKRQLMCQKYNGSTGTISWQHAQPSENPSGNAFMRKLFVKPNNTIYFVGGEKGINGNEQAIVGRIHPSGTPGWQRKIDNVTGDVTPSDIDLSGGQIYVSCVTDPALPAYQTTIYSELELDTTNVWGSGGKPIYPKNQLIVRFQPSVLDSSAIDNVRIEHGSLSAFMNTAAYSTLMSTLEGSCLECDIKAVKIFNGLTTDFVTTTSRLGEPMSVPDFWTTLLLEFPSPISITAAHTAFKTIPSIVGYSHPNYLGELHSAPNDSLYNLQGGLHPTGTYPNGHINVEEAWQVIPSGGEPFVRGGVYDSGVFWKHKDFGYDGSNPSSSKVVDGWDYKNGTNLKNIPNGADTDNHGTCVAGIIGAVRNNTKGIAGIAGGNDSTGNKGVSLYSFAVSGSNSGYNNVGPFTYLNYHANALIFGSILDTSANRPIKYTFGLNFINNSNGWPADAVYSPAVFIDTNIVLLTEAVHFTNRANVTFVASRGNYYGSLNVFNYPSSIDDDWVLSVTGSGKDGYFCHDVTTHNSAPVNCEFHTSWGYEVDIAAPASSALTRTSYYGGGYGVFGASSGAAPHVSGVVGLLMSYMNNPNASDDYRNLAPEDCEEIIQRSAKDDAITPGYDQWMGWGRLDAGKALRLVEKPYYTLHHFGTKYNTNSISYSLFSNNDTVMLGERYKNKAGVYFPKGKYVLKTYKVSAMVSHPLSSTDTIKAYWPRPSSSEVLELFRNKVLRPRERDTIVSCTNASAQLHGYIYQVRDTVGNVLGWWPCDTSLACQNMNSLFEYSVLTRNYASTVGVDKVSHSLFGADVFPNPTSGQQTIVLETPDVENVRVELFDLTGRLVKVVFSGKSQQGRTIVVNDVNHLPNSMYIYVIRIGDKLVNKKFIKH